MGPHSIEFTADGNRIVVANTDELHVVDLASGTSTAHAVPALRAFLTVGDEVWLAAGEPAMIEIAGRADRIALAGTHGRLVRGAGAQAVWLGTRAVQVIRNEAGLDVQQLPAVDFALPLGPSRILSASQQIVQLRDATTTRWSTSPVTDGRVCEGAAISDGRALALYLAQRGDRGALVVLDATNGNVQHRITLRSASLVRFAPKRGLAIVVVEQRRLVLIDLRFGRILADHTQDHDITDLAIDSAGQQIALRHADEIVHLETKELLRAPAPARIEVPVIDDEPPPAPLEPLRAIAPQRSLPPCPALPARTSRRLPTDDEHRALLTAHRAWVVGLLDHAIARAWDEGRATPDRPTPQRNLIESIAGNLRGLAGEDIDRARARLDAAVARWNDALAHCEGVAPIRALADEHELDTLSVHILMLVAAPSLWGELAQLFGMLVSDPARPFCDELLVTHAFASLADPQQIAAALSADAPLVRAGLVHVGAGLQRPFLPLSVDPVVIRLLRGASHGVAGARPATRAFEALHLRDDIKCKIIDGLPRAAAPLRIVVRGRSGSGRHTLLATIAAAAGRALAVIDTVAILRTGTVDELHAAMRRAHIAGLVPCLDGLETVEFRAEIRELLHRATMPVFVRLPTDASPPLIAGYLAIDLPSQTVSERADVWSDALARHDLAVADTAELAARFAIGPAVIERIALGIEPGEGVEARIDAAIRQHLDSDLAEVATRVHRLATWSQVVLPADIQDSVTELIGRIRHRRQVFDTWGFDRVMSTSRGVTALFQGGPGTGKTLVASAIANELGLELYRVDVSRIMSKWIGETEQRLSRLFDAAEDANAIILFDEADSLFGKRTEVKSSVDRYANVEVNYLLQRLDTFEGIAILTSNFGSSIDSAFKRRLSFRLTFPFPDEDQRERLWRAHLPAQLPIRGELDLATLAQRYRLSGGYIRNCALRAAFLAAEQGGCLTADHLERAIKAEFREIGKLAETGALE